MALVTLLLRSEINKNPRIASLSPPNSLEVGLVNKRDFRRPSRILMIYQTDQP